MGKMKMGYHNRLTSVISDDDCIGSKKDKKNRREKTISCSMESKILKEALIQQKEMEDEEEQKLGQAFSFLDLAAVSAFDEEVDDFSGFSETYSECHFDEEAINEDDERLLDAFLCKDGGRQPTLVDVIATKLREKNAEVLSAGDLPQPKLGTAVIDLYKGVGKSLSKYTVGKMPKAFKGIPSLQQWDEILYLTEPANWSPNAMYQATRIFCSNFGVDKARHFYKLVLLPRVREDILKNKRLHFALYQALKKSLYKPAAFFKGILFPLCQSGTCNLREAVIIGSIIRKVSIPSIHSSVALLRLAEMEYCGTTSYFIKLLLEKKYALPYRVLDALVTHFTRFYDDSRMMPVIWHQSLLAFVQRYKHELTKDGKDNLKMLIRKQHHKLVTPEISTELDNSRTRGQKEEDEMNIDAPLCIINKAIEEDRFDIPEIPMEED